MLQSNKGIIPVNEMELLNEQKLDWMYEMKNNWEKLKNLSEDS